MLARRESEATESKLTKLVVASTFECLVFLCRDFAADTGTYQRLNRIRLKQGNRSNIERVYCKHITP